MFITVNKNVTTRLFEKINGDVINPGPGTVVDNVIVENDSQNMFDFYMVANDNPKTACALPVHYSVITNTTNMNKREIQDLVHQQCYAYQGFGGPIKTPASVMYAHKIAMYAHDCKFMDIKAQPSAKLSQKLHYL